MVKVTKAENCKVFTAETEQGHLIGAGDACEEVGREKPHWTGQSDNTLWDLDFLLL